MYEVFWTKQAKKDHCRISRSNVCAKRLIEILNVVRKNPFEETPGHDFEKLKNYKPSTYTRRLDYTNRFVYTIIDNLEEVKNLCGASYDGVVVIHRMWGHFPPLRKRG